MNATTLLARPPLADLLGVSWMVEARAGGIAWDRDGGTVGFGLEDGTLAVARTEWAGRPTVRARQGGVELVPASGPAPSIARIAVHAGACVGLAADPDGGFLSGGADGQFARVAADGTIDTLARFGRLAAGPVAAGRGGWRVCAAGSTLVRFGGGGQTLELPDPVSALAVAPDGSRVAIGQARGIALWAGGDTARVLEGGGVQTALAWSGDARLVASASADGEVLVWEAGGGGVRRFGGEQLGARAIAFLAGAALLVASAGGALICWDVAAGTEGRCGAPSRERVVQIAAHPRRAMIASGYGNGAVAICQPASPEIVLVRGAGAGPVDALSWSPAGDALAYASAGLVGLVALPGPLFRWGGAAP